MLNNLGLLFGRAGDMDRAERYFRDALGRRPDYGEAANNLALVFVSRGQADAAVDLLQGVLKPDTEVRGRLRDAGKDPLQRRPFERGDRRARAVAADKSEACRRSGTAPAMERALIEIAIDLMRESVPVNRISRRRFFAAAAAALGAGLAYPRASRVSARAWRERRDLYPQGVASGDPTPDSVILWTRRPPVSESRARRLTVDVASDPEFAHIVATGVAAISADSDWTCRFLAARLKPATELLVSLGARRGTDGPVGVRADSPNAVGCTNPGSNTTSTIINTHDETSGASRPRSRAVGRQCDATPNMQCTISRSLQGSCRRSSAGEFANPAPSAARSGRRFPELTASGKSRNLPISTLLQRFQSACGRCGYLQQPLKCLFERPALR